MFKSDFQIPISLLSCLHQKHQTLISQGTCCINFITIFSRTHNPWGHKHVPGPLRWTGHSYPRYPPEHLRLGEWLTHPGTEPPARL